MNWQGARDWAALQAKLEREGETFNVEKLRAPPLDEARNFCAIEPLRGIALAASGDSAAKAKLEALEGTVLPAGDHNSQKPALGEGLAFGRGPDVHGWVEYLRAQGYCGPASSSPEGHGMLAALDAAHPLLKRLAVEAEARPLAGFVPGTPVAHPRLSADRGYYSGPVRAGKALVVRALVAGGEGDHQAACQSIQAALRFAAALQREPSLLALLVERHLHEITEAAVWEMLHQRLATDGELQAMQASLSALDFQAATLNGLRGEVAEMIDLIDFVQGDAAEFVKYSKADLFEGAAVPPPSILFAMWHALPAGWFDENKTVVASLVHEELVSPLKAGGLGEAVRRPATFEKKEALRGGPWQPYYFFARTMIPPYNGIVLVEAYSETVRCQGVAACALERWYLQHHAYPTTLQELVPAFLPVVPADPMDNRPMRYALTDDGRYMLWSIGPDGKDDRGKVNTAAKSEITSSQLRHHTYHGDWVWQYTPVKQ